MSTHNPHEGSGHNPEEIDTSKGFEQSDVRTTGIVVFLMALLVFVGVSGILVYGIGKLINAELNREDGPTNKWSAEVNIRELGNMPANPEMQQKVEQLTEKFPTPRVQLDDGNQDVAALHQREDLLLDHYTWADRSQGKVRLPIDRAMAIVAQRGLPVAPAVQGQKLMAGDSVPTVTAPLTSGFARTGYEQEQAARAAEEQRVQ